MHALILVAITILIAPPEQPPAAAAEFRAIWRVALQEVIRSRGGARIVYFNESVGSCERPPIQQPCFEWPEAALVTEGITEAPRARLRAALDAKPLAIDGVDLPQMQPMSRNDVETIYRQFGNPEALWPEFYSRYPGAGGYALLSIPALDDSQQNAWLLIEYSHLGGGERALLVLKRDGSIWQLARKIVLWQA